MKEISTMERDSVIQYESPGKTLLSKDTTQMPVTISALETRYSGYRFRSRLEARYAVVLDHFGIEWQYETQGYETPTGCYLPDFWLPFPRNTWVEIKGSEPPDERLQRSFDLAMFTQSNLIIFVGDLGNESGHYVLEHHYLHEPERAQIESGIETFSDVRFGFGRRDRMEHALERGTILWGTKRGAEVWEAFALLRLDSRRIPEAVEVMRSARFEFGEEG